LSRFSGFVRLAVSAAAVGALAAQADARPVNLDRTVFVSPVAGNPVASGARLLAALADITDASAANPWLIRIEPGVYDLNGQSLAMKSYVDIEGSGPGVTTVRSTVEMLGTIRGADFAELRALTIWNEAAARAIALRNQAVFFTARGVDCRARGGSELSTAVSSNIAGGVFIDVNALAQDSPTVTGMAIGGGLLTRVRASGTGGGQFAYGLFNSASSGEVRDVVARAHGTQYATAIRNEGGGPVLRNVRAIGRGDVISEGIVNGGGSAARILGGEIDVAGGSDFAAGMRNEFASPLISDLSMVVDGTSSAFGVVSLFSGTPVLRNLSIDVRGGGGSGVAVQSDNTQVTVEASTLVSNWLALRNFGGAATSIRVGTSRVAGGVDAGSGILRCVASYDGAFAPLGANCLP
jgi:hypothetical protein